MNPLNIIYPVLNALERGSVFRTAFAWFLRILAVLTALAGFYFIIQILKVAFRADEFIVTLAGLITVLFVISLSVVNISISLYRADSILNLGESDFTVIPIVSIFFKYLGEAIATFFIHVGIIGFISLLLIGSNEYGRMIFSSFDLGGGSPFVGAISSLLLGVIMAFLALCIFYYISEALSVVVSIARNVKLLVSIIGSAQSTKGIINTEDVSIHNNVCPVCHVNNELDAKFCENCGNKL